MHSAENTGDVRCLTDAPLPFFFVRAGSTDAARSHVCVDGLGRPLIALGLRSWLRDGNGPHAYWWPRPRRLRLALA